MRPTKLDDLLRKRLLDSLKEGNSMRAAAATAGIAESTLHDWCARGRRGDPVYSEFAEQVKGARGSAEAFYVGVIKRAADDGTWQAAAWWLERTRPRRYGRPHAPVASPLPDVAKLSRDEAGALLEAAVVKAAKHVPNVRELFTKKGRSAS